MRIRAFIGHVRKAGPVGIACLVLLTVLTGCSKKTSDEPIPLKGRIEKIQRTTDSSGVITLRFFNEKQNKEMVGSATYTSETKVEKNGAPATIGDLQEGVQVNGLVRSTRQDGKKVFHAVLIKIESPGASGGG